MEQDVILGCYLLQQFPMSHRVIPVYPDECLEDKMIEGEEWLYYVHFLEDQFERKLENIITYLSKEDAGIFFSELIWIGFREARLHYEKFVQPNKPQLTIVFSSDKPQFTEALDSLRVLFDDSEIQKICMESIMYGVESLDVLSYEEVFGLPLVGVKWRAVQVVQINYSQAWGDISHRLKNCLKKQYKQKTTLRVVCMVTDTGLALYRTAGAKHCVYFSILWIYFFNYSMPLCVGPGTLIHCFRTSLII